MISSVSSRISSKISSTTWPSSLTCRAACSSRISGLVEGARVLAEVLAHSLHLLLTKEALGAGTPDELLELLDRLFAEKLAREGVDVVAVFHLCGLLE
jgi:hypothetical protein